MISTGKLIHQIFMKFHNWFSYAYVEEFQGVNHTAYEMYECPLWVESGHSAGLQFSASNVRFRPIADLRVQLRRNLIKRLTKYRVPSGSRAPSPKPQPLW